VEKKPQKPLKDEVLREFPPLGKYRIRLVHNPKRPAEEAALDIREYVSSETFEGFTRRGIRLGDRVQLDLLREILKEVLEQSGFARLAPTLPLQ
jgi:hypothetical protein